MSCLGDDILHVYRGFLKTWSFGTLDIEKNSYLCILVLFLGILVLMFLELACNIGLIVVGMCLLIGINRVSEYSQVMHAG